MHPSGLTPDQVAEIRTCETPTVASTGERYNISTDMVRKIIAAPEGSE